MKNLFDIRRDFTLATLDEHDLIQNPISFFEQWFEEATTSEVLEPNAMNLATVRADGKPSSRVVLLKQIKNNGFVFFTNYDSNKGQQLEQNKYCALNFCWHELERQVRIEGIAQKLPPSESDIYFTSRPLKSKLGAWASPQSKIIPDRKFLEDLVVNYENKLNGKPISRPSNWGGYIVIPDSIEFWQGRENRLHDRIFYSRDRENNWIINRLAP